MNTTRSFLNHYDIASLFGRKTQLYSKFMQEFRLQKETKNSEIYKSYKTWISEFNSVFGPSIPIESFFNQLYYVFVLRFLLYNKISQKFKLNLLDDIEKITQIVQSLIDIDELKYFESVDFHIQKFKSIIEKIKDNIYDHEDLFFSLYQDLFLSEVRHDLGEFYTPIKLVKKMIKNTYKFGNRVLDPSCGSGNFIVEIILNIFDNDSFELEMKNKVFNEIFGFDINPLAILTTKINILLIFLDKFEEIKEFPKINIYLKDALFGSEKSTNKIDFDKLYNTFDLIIGNPPWLTYKDLKNSNQQKMLRNLAGELQIKPRSQYITHIELASVFFYAIPTKYLKIYGTIFFVLPKSVLNGDHCKEFRAFKIFDNLEIWDFPENYIFNVNHICLKARYIGNSNEKITDKYPIKTLIFNNKIEKLNDTHYSTLKTLDDGAMLILPEKDISYLSEIKVSQYKKKFYQGATLVPRTLIFFQIEDETEEFLSISTDSDVYSRSKKNWRTKFNNIKIEKEFRFKTFLNSDIIPFFLKRTRNIFLPIERDSLCLNMDYLKKYPFANKFYIQQNEIYQEKKKNSSKIRTLFDNLNYWNKLTKQSKFDSYLVIYNASGSNLKSVVIELQNDQILIGSENYYYSTENKNEAYYLCGILNTPLLTKYIKLIKSSRHIHKRPFSFPIPIYCEDNKNHYKIANIAKMNSSYVHDLFYNNPNITGKKIQTILNSKYQKLNKLLKKVVFS